MATLYEIDKEISQCFRQGDMVINGESGEVFDKDYLDKLNIDRNQKIENIGCFIKNLLSDAEQYSKEAEIQADRASKAKQKSQKLKEYLAYMLDGQKFSSAKVEIGWRKFTSVDVTCAAEFLPEPYRKEKITYTADKTLLKKALSAGEQIEGCSIVEKQNIQVK